LHLRNRMAKGSCGTVSSAGTLFYFVVKEVVMKAVVVEKIGSFKIMDVAMPVCGEDEVLIRVTVTGLCRTDLKLIRVGHRDLVLPRIPGEEVVGIIEAVGNKVEGFSVGQRVYVYPGTSCGTCAPCAAGAGNLCTSMEIMGFHRDGGFAEYVAAPAQSLIAVPDYVTDEEAVFAEPLSCCLNALELARLTRGETIAIWGAGPAGRLLGRAAQALGAIPDYFDPDEMRAALAGGFIEAPVKTFDVCIVAAGSMDAYVQALNHLGPRGRLVVFSGLNPDNSGTMVDLNMLHYLEQTIVGAYGCSFCHSVEAIRLIGQRAIPVKDLISHRNSLSNLDEALTIVEQRTCMKIHLYP
jgi:L-iditol 2-dehydrogenase